MKTRPAYLVIDTGRSLPAIVRVTQSWPTLGPQEITVRVSLTIDDELHPTHTLVVDDPDAVIEAVTVPAEPPVDEAVPD